MNSKNELVQSKCRYALKCYPCRTVIGSLLKKSCISFTEDCQRAANLLGLTFEQMEALDASYHGLKMENGDDCDCWNIGQTLRTERLNNQKTV